MVVDSLACIVSAQRLDGNRKFACEDFAVYDEMRALYGDAAFAPLCDEAMACGARRLYVPSLDLSDKAIDKLIDYALSNDTRIAAVCSRTLTEAGLIDSRFSRSPVMLLYEFGLLDRSEIISGVYLDKDDLSLMAQENVALTVLPSSDSGAGFGVAPVSAALERGVRVKIGSGEGTFNPSRSVIYEAAVLQLLVSAQMNKKRALSCEELAIMCLSDDSSDDEKEDVARAIHDKKLTPIYRRQ